MARSRRGNISDDDFAFRCGGIGAEFATGSVYDPSALPPSQAAKPTAPTIS
jgi:hypothetical protein